MSSLCGYNLGSNVKFAKNYNILSNEMDVTNTAEKRYMISKNFIILLLNSANQQ